VRLTCAGTANDLSRQQVQLREGLDVLLYMDDADEQGREDRLIVEGSVTFSDDEQCWVAAIDWQNIRHESNEPAALTTAERKGQVSALLPSSDTPPSPEARSAGS